MQMGIKNKKIWGFFLILFFYLTNSFANPQVFFDEANKFYSDGNFKKAIELYQKILDSGYASKNIYYNMGNAYFKSGDLVKAIVFYERAKKISTDPDITKNLEVAYLATVDKIQEKPVLPIMKYYHKIRNLFTVYSIKYYFGIFLLLASLMLGISLLIFNYNTLRKILRIFSGLSFIFSLFFAMIMYDLYQIYNENFAIIDVDKTEIMSSPDKNANSVQLFDLHKGTKVKVLSKIDNWTEISISKDKTGWVENSKIIVI